MNRKNPCFAVFFYAAVLSAASQAAQESARVTSAQATGVLTGTVSNTATRNLLEGARVELPQLGLTALTDNTGRFVLAGVQRQRVGTSVSSFGFRVSG